MDSKSAALRAEDPTTLAAELAELAAAHPELCGVIFRHPNVYEDLKTWIRTNYPEHVQAEVGPTEATTAEVRGSWWDRPRAALLTSLAIGAVALAIVAAIAVPTAARVVDFGSQTEAVAASPIVESEALSDPDPVPSPSQPPASASRVPTSCAGLYSPTYASSIQTAGFRPDTTARLNTPVGTDDRTLADLIRNSPRLECTWHRSNSDTAGLETSVLEVDASTSAAATARLQALGFTRLDELGGVRFVFEKVRSDGTPYGESHMLRDGLWFATRWVEYGPNGYSADMVAQVFG